MTPQQAIADRLVSVADRLRDGIAVAPSELHRLADDVLRHTGCANCRTAAAPDVSPAQPAAQEDR